MDHPGVPATFVIDEGLAELLLDGESLGRWSLYDVHASRLIASAFSVKLGEEEITFLADEPIDFAYKGVEHMAEAWARYKTMTLPRRLVAVRRSRREARPSRISELREAMLVNLGVIESLEPKPPAPQPEPVPEPLAAVPAVEVVPEHPLVDEVVEETAAAGDTPAEQPERRPRLIPGPGLFARPAAMEPELEPEVLEPVAVEPELEPEVLEPVAVEPELEPEFLEPVAVEPEPEILEPVAAEADPGDVPEVVKELISASNGQSSAEGLLVDLGAYEEGLEQPVEPASDNQVQPEQQPVLAATSAEKSGLLGAVRSAFMRNREPHIHDFVDAPGGIGITRHICRECGHISIGVSD